MSIISSRLMFYIKAGLIAGHDVGFDFSDFLILFFSLSEEDQLVFRNDLGLVIEELSKTKVLYNSLGVVSSKRIDGTSSEISDEEWCEYIKKRLRVFDDSYIHSKSIMLLAKIAGMGLGESQVDFYRHALLGAKHVKVVPLGEVFTKSEVSKIKRRKFTIKQCYENSMILSRMFPDSVQYVEGEVVVCGIPIGHAFNKFGDKYVDVTSELVLKQDVRDIEYTSFLEVAYDEAVQLSSLAGYYGNFLFTKYKNLKLGVLKV